MDAVIAIEEPIGEGTYLAELTINKKDKVSGGVSINRELVYAGSNPVLEVTGLMKTDKYFEEITEIETGRYVIQGVRVTKESFGSDDDEIIYAFRADNIEVKEVTESGR